MTNTAAIPTPDLLEAFKLDFESMWPENSYDWTTHAEGGFEESDLQAHFLVWLKVNERLQAATALNPNVGVLIGCIEQRNASPSVGASPTLPHFMWSMSPEQSQQIPNGTKLYAHIPAPGRPQVEGISDRGANVVPACLEHFSKHAFNQLAVFEDGRTPLFLTEEQYNAIRGLISTVAPAPLLTLKTAFGDLRPCIWTHNEDTDAWKTQCGKTWHFGNDGPEENGMSFCHACGGVLTVEPSTNVED